MDAGGLKGRRRCGPSGQRVQADVAKETGANVGPGPGGQRKLQKGMRGELCHIV